MTEILRKTATAMMTKPMAKKVTTPLTEEKIARFRAGDMLLLNGIVYGARDMAHKRMLSSIKNNESLPFDINGAAIFYVGPSPAPPGKSCGSVGPTTSARMDSLSQPLLARGLKAMIGKGQRSPDFKKLLSLYNAVYMVAVGGIAAYLSQKVESIKPIAYNDLGAEAIFSIILKDFPVFVAYDVYGGDIFRQALRVE